MISIQPHLRTDTMGCSATNLDRRPALPQTVSVQAQAQAQAVHYTEENIWWANRAEDRAQSHELLHTRHATLKSCNLVD
jgi:hypothetical protein